MTHLGTQTKGTRIAYTVGRATILTMDGHVILGTTA